jgi:amidase
VRVEIDGETVAESTRARVLYETGLPPRWYLPPEDVRTELLVPSSTRTRCAYKGEAMFVTLELGGREHEGFAWTYVRALREAAELLASLGHEVVEADPRYGRAADALIPRYLRGVAQDAERMARPERLQRRTRGFARIGRLFPDALLQRALRDEAAHAARMGELYRDHDLLLTPVSTRLPVQAAEWEGLSAARTLLGMSRVYPFTGIWNMTGQPAISIPAPPTADGLPVGAQFVGPANCEPLLLSLAAQLERELAWPERRPPLD